MAGNTEMALPGFSFVVFGTLLIVFLASMAIFYVLVRRMTRERHRIAVGEWAREHGAKVGPIEPADLPASIAAMAPEIRQSVKASRGHLLRLIITERHWNVLLRRSGGDWIPTGLRPAAHETSFLDAFQLPVFPAYSTSERFHLVSADHAAARKLSKSSARALIPADIGLLLWGEWIILDFTRRPFDPIEFGRMISLVEQLVHALPQ